MDTHIDTDLNIPLAYISLDYSKYDLNKNIYEDFNNYKKEAIIPEQELPGLNVKIFNEFEEEVIIEDVVKRKGEKYYYYPADMRVFYPKTFLYQLIVKKNMQYRISNNYNINISCVDSPNVDSLSRRLETIFTNPAGKGWLPPNIKINDNSLSPYALGTGTLRETDFIFIESPDGMYYDGAKQKPIDFTEFSNANTNVWISCDDHDYYEMLDIGVDTKFKLKFPLLTRNDIIESSIMFDTTKGTNKFKKFHNIFIGNYAPILIVENIGSNFQIISHSSVTKNPEKYASLIYEAMMYVYLNSYKKTDYEKEWITYDMPDYEVINGKLNKKNKFVAKANIDNLLGIKKSDYIIYHLDIIGDENSKAAIENIDLTDEISAIKLVDILDGHLVFTMDKSVKVSKYVEPPKPLGWTSLYANGKMYYIKTIHYAIESNIDNNIFIEEQENFIKVNIYPFKSTKNGINVKYDFELMLPLLKAENEFISKIKEVSYDIYIRNGIIRYIESDRYEEHVNSVKLMTIEVKQTTNAINIFDMRQLGGGLPEDLPDNYNLLDIGHINGRPYREAGSFVLTLPKRFEKYKKEIMEAVDEYKIAEDCPIIFFEDKEEE